VLKDLNYDELGLKMFLGESQKKAVMAQLEKDCVFLTAMNIMDHSLLLGQHDGDDAKATEVYVALPPDEKCALISEENLKGPLIQLREDRADLGSVFQSHKGGLRGFSESAGKKSRTRKEIYFVGIIDILQEFNMKKRIESTYKGIRYNKNAISAIASQQYADRFLKYLASKID